MTQRLETKIGTQRGLESNFQSDQSQGYQIADNIIYRPVGGISKRRGAKKLVETVDGETKRLVMPTQANDGVISIQEDDATGEAKVLGYSKEGTRVDLYSLEGSRFLTLDPDPAFSAYDKVRLEFPEEIYTTDFSFIESAFEEKTGAMSGFWTLQTSFTTIAVEQDSVDPDLLRVSRFVNLPTKNNEITLTATNSLSVAPTLLDDYEIISVSSDYFTIYPNLGAPAWTSTGDTGTINFTFRTFKVIELAVPALTTDSLLNQNVKCFYESNPSFKTKKEVTFRYFNDKSCVVIDPGSNPISDLDVTLLAKNKKDGELNLFTKVNIPVEQDNVDRNYLRISVSTQTFPSANYPLKIQECFLSNPTIFLNPPTELNTYYDIVEFDGSFYYLYPTGQTPPAVKLFGGSGRIECDFRTLILYLISPRPTSTFTSIGNLLYNFSKTFEIFSTSQIKTVLEDRSGDEIVFNADQGQFFLSSENNANPQAAYYGVPQAIDVLPYYFTSTLTSGAARPLGVLTEQTRYAYKAVLKRKTNNQIFVGSPSPTFFLETPDESSSYTTLSGAQIGIDASGEVFFTLSAGGATNLLIQLKNVTSTPTIADFTSITVYWEGFGGRYLWRIEDQISLLGTTVSSITQADVFLCKSSFCEVCLPESFFNDLKNNLNIDDFYVDLYRTVGVDTSSVPDTSQFFLCKSVELPNIQAPTIGIYDDEISDLTLESQLPLYTNPTEEGVLKSNDLAPQHQNFIEKNGVFYLGDLKKQQVLTKDISSKSTIAPSDPGIFTTTFTYTTLLSTYSSGFFNLSSASTLDSRRVYIQSGVVYDFEDDSVLVSLYQDFVLSEFFDTLIPSLGNYAVGEINYFYWNEIRPMNGSPTFQLGVQKTTAKLVLDEVNEYNYYIFLLSNQTFTTDKATIAVQTRYFREIENNSFLQSFDYFEDTFGVEEFRYQIAYSKPFEPAAFPPLHFLAVGSTKNIIYGIFSVRDSLIVATKEGFYRLIGDNELDYVLTPIERDTVPLSPLLMTKQQDQVFALTQKGFGACSESSFQIIDLPVQDLTERFLQLYRDNLDNFTLRQIYTAAPRFLNQIVFFMPSLKSKDTTKSTFGLSLDTSIMNFSTVDLYVDDEEKNGVLLQSFDASRFLNESYNVPSYEPSSLQVVRSQVNRSDFAQNEAPIELGTFWECDASITAGSSILTINTALEHRLQTGDYVTLIAGEDFVNTVGTGLSASLFENAVHSALVGGDPRVFSIDLGSTSGDSVFNKVRFRFGRAGLPATLSLTTGSLLCTLTLASQADVGWLVGQKIYIKKPYDAQIEPIESLLINSKNISSVSLNTIQITLPTISTITTSVPCVFSEDLRDPYKQTFSFVANNFINNQSFAFKYLNDRLLYPFESENTGSRIQGFLERPWDIQFKPDRPSMIFDGVKTTIQTSRITGGDPCSLKNFGQIILTMQSIFSMTKCMLAFQGDRYDAAGAITFRSQNQLDQPFDPAFAETLWSVLREQWASLTNPSQGWTEARPFTPIRVTTPTNVAQSTYLSIYILHDRPFETMAMGSIAVNGVYIDPTSTGV